MSLKIVSVAFLDWKALGSDQFFVQVSDDEVMLYEANQRTGAVEKLVDEPAPLRFVTASIEKFNNMYRVENPVELDSLDDLPSYVGKFEITSDTACRYVP